MIVEAPGVETRKVSAQMRVGGANCLIGRYEVHLRERMQLRAVTSLVRKAAMLEGNIIINPWAIGLA